MAKPGTRIGWIGTGKMGNPMSRRVLRAGMEVVIYEPVAKNRASVVAEGATVAQSLTELIKRADVIVSTIPNDHVLRIDCFLYGWTCFAASSGPGLRGNEHGFPEHFGACLIRIAENKRRISASPCVR